METINFSYRVLRRLVGLLGIILPFILIVGNWGVEHSISFFYYTKMSTVFTGVLITFALVLITYKGTDTSKGLLNENNLTHAAGFFALLVALIPTKYGEPIEQLYYVHNDLLRGWIHNISAALFIFILGLVVLKVFTKAKYYKNMYKLLGWLVMIGLAFTISAFIFKKQMFEGAIFWGESFSLWAFGIAWLRRGIPKNLIKKTS